MKTKTVMNPVEIPMGYDLEEGEQPRFIVGGDLVLIDGKVVQCWNLEPVSDQKYYILVREWEPTSEKAYMVSSNEDDVGTSKGYIVIFKRVVDGQYVDAEGVHWERCYADSQGVHWEHCWPIPADMIGE